MKKEAFTLPKRFTISRAEFALWAADNERLIIAGLQPTGPGPLDYDENTVDTVQERCIEMFGEIQGLRYYQGLIAGLPERNKELFPELYDENGEELS